MIKILDLYIAKVILSGTLLALLALGALDVFFDVINELEDVGKGDFGYSDAFMYVLLTCPQRVYVLFPAAVLVGSLMSLGALANNSELVAMRAAGVSVTRIVMSAAQAGLVALVLVFLLGEFVVPPAQRYAQSVDSKKQGLQVSSSLGALWARDGDNYVNIGKVYPDLHLQDVHVHRFDNEQQLLSSTHAQSVLFRQQQWELHDVERTVFDSDKMFVEHKEIEYWSQLLDPQMLEVLTVEPTMMSALELHRYIEYLTRNKLESGQYQLAFWLKMTTPVSCVVMLFIVLPFVFVSLRSVNTGQLLIVGILLGLSFYILIQIAARAGQIYGVPPFISATFPVLCFMAAGLLGLTKIR